MSNPLVAPRQDTTRGWTGIWIADDIQSIVDGCESGSWIDASIGGFAASMDALGFVTDPLGSLVAWGVSWLMEHVKPLREALDWLAGDPAQIAAYAETWRRVAGAARQAAADLGTSVQRELGGWTGAAADAYRARASEHEGALNAASSAADAIGMIVEGAGLVVAMVRMLVRDLIAEFVSVLAVRLGEWLAEEAASFGIATPWVIAQVGTLVAKWAAKIARLLHGLAETFRRLAPFVRRLRELLEELFRLLRRGEHAGGGGTRPSRKPDPNAKPRGPRTDAHPTRVKDRAKRRENESADVLAQNGFDVEQNPPPKPNGKEPDYKIEGEYFDCYAPQTRRLDGIRDEISGKVKEGQADRIVLNLDDCPRSMDEIRDILTRKPIAGLKEIKVVKDGKVVPFYPFN